jgi:hypothetical protein
VIDQRAHVLAAGTYGTDKAGYAQILRTGQAFPDRVLAIGGCNGIGKHIAHRLVLNCSELRSMDVNAQVHQRPIRLIGIATRAIGRLVSRSLERPENGST